MRWLPKVPQTSHLLNLAVSSQILSDYPFCRLCHCCLPSSLKQFSLLSYSVLVPLSSSYFLKCSFIFLTESYSSAHLLNPCLVLHSRYIHLLRILIRDLTVFYALMTFISVSLAWVLLLSPHSSLSPRRFHTKLILLFSLKKMYDQHDPASHTSWRPRDNLTLPFSFSTP